MVWWNDEGGGKGELQFTSGWDARVDLFAYKILCTLLTPKCWVAERGLVRPARVEKRAF
jgi:hypothetical protein